jgi:DNA-directed RNA polymerase specialized sigma24 family protein
LDEELLTVAEIAQFLRLNEQTVRNWIFSTAFEVVP